MPRSDASTEIGTGSLFVPNKLLLILFVLSLPVQTISLSGSAEGGVGLKIYNVLFVLLFFGSINYKATIHRIFPLTAAFGSLSTVFMFLYLVVVTASIAWAGESSDALSFFIKIAFVFVEVFFFANLFYFHPKSFYTLRFAFEVSGIVIFFALLFQIQRMGLWDYVITSEEVANAPQAKNTYFGSVGLTFGGGKNLVGSWEAIVAILAYLHYSMGGRFRLKRQKLFVLFSLACSVTAIFLTLSRTSILTIFLSLYLYHLIKGSRLNVKLLMKTFFALGAFVLIGITVLSTAEFGIFGHLTSVGTSKDPGVSDRMALWNTAFEAINDKPLLGQGLGNGYLTFGRYQTPGITGEDNFHNLYLQNMVELGVPGGIIFALFWFSLIFALYRTYRSNPLLPKDIVLSTLLVNVAFTIMAFFQFKGGEPDIWLFIALNIALQISPKTIKRNSPELMAAAPAL